MLLNCDCLNTVDNGDVPKMISVRRNIDDKSWVLSISLFRDWSIFPAIEFGKNTGWDDVLSA